MPQYLLRVEAVNLFATLVADTDDLSTRRGGGLLALNAVADLRLDGLEPIATGASVGLFRFDGDRLSPADALTAVRRQLQSGDRQHATFTADVVEVSAPGWYRVAEQQALARNRWGQMQQQSLSLAGVWDGGTRECELDCVRPATATTDKGGKKGVPVSASVAARRNYGRDARQQFYDRELGKKLGLAFTDNFQELAGANGPPAGLVPENLHDKLAVLYMDGNGFGSEGRRRWANGPDGWKLYGEWSEGIRNNHRKLLRGVLDAAQKREDASWRTSAGEIRLETLLWGGDEIIWVVPAWKGWELVKLVFAEQHTIGGRPVSYSAGLVFCHVKAAIKDIVRLAHDLGDKAKEVGGDTNRLAYEVMESFDDVYGDLDKHRRKFLPPDTDPAALILEPGKVQAAWSHLTALAAGSRDFPTRQLYKLCNAWRRGEPTKPHADRLLKSEAKTAIEGFRQVFGQDEVSWLHLLQMRPYLPAGGES